MTQRDSKDLADALAALAAGHHDEPEEGAHHQDGEIHAEHAAQAPAPVKPPAVPVSKAAPVAAKTSRPSAPGQVGAVPRNPVAAPPVKQRPAVPRLTPSDSFGPAVPAAPARPSAPSARPAAPTTRQAAPPPPSLPAAEEAPAMDQAMSSSYAQAMAQMSAEDPAIEQAAADDAAVIAYASPADAYKPKNLKAKDPLDGRRTMIPLLLTLGVILPVLGIITLSSDEDSPQMQIVTKGGCYGLLAAGAIALVLAFINMMFVQSELAKRARGRRA